MYEQIIQKIIVEANLPYGDSLLAVDTAAKHGIVVMLNAMNAIKPGIVIPVAVIIWLAAEIPSSESIDAS